MQISRELLLLLSILQAASAFYPYVPEWKCLEEGTCTSSKPSDEGRIESRGSELSIKVAQRLPKDNAPHNVQIRSLADRLAQKYNRGTKVSRNQLEERGTVVKRTNNYPVVSAAVPTQSNSAGIDQDGTDFSYFATIEFGSNLTPIRMLLDTGAGTSWIMGPSCTTDACKLHNSFGPADSTSFASSSDTFNISYGSGLVSGIVGSDTLRFAGLTIPMSIGIADYTSNDFESFPMDGILALSLDKSSGSSFWDDVIAAKVLHSNIFGVDLNRAADGPNTGQINFGAPNTALFSGNLNYMDVASTKGDWEITMDNVGFGTTGAGITNRLTYVDTGTSFIFTPAADAKTLHALVPGFTQVDDATYTVPCDTTTPMILTFGGVSYSISSKDWVGHNSSGQCISNIYGQPVVDGAWLVGDTFLKNVYAVFDVDQTRIGFASKISTVATSTTSSSTSSSTGGPNSFATSQLSSPTLPSSNTVSNTESLDTISPVQSNVATTGSTIATPTSESGTSATAITSGSYLGLDGHETPTSSSSTPSASSRSSTTAIGASATASKTSKASRLSSSIFVSVAALGALITFS
ncbi:hypothetical protein B7494_g4770 [Chlorociboria aeruginascens]|nr:hypothetical protein B7494_g4770 [Chlorociboria aeruginascens]